MTLHQWFVCDACGVRMQHPPHQLRDGKRTHDACSDVCDAALRRTHGLVAAKDAR